MNIRKILESFKAKVVTICLGAQEKLDGLYSVLPHTSLETRKLPSPVWISATGIKGSNELINIIHHCIHPKISDDISFIRGL